MSAVLSPALLIENVIAASCMITCIAGKLKLSHPTNELPVLLLEAIALHKVNIIEQLEVDRKTDVQERLALTNHDGKHPVVMGRRLHTLT